MAGRIDYESYVGKEINGYKVISYEGKDLKKKHWYHVEFLDTGNKYLDHFGRVRDGKVVDLQKRKLEKSKRVATKLRERTRLTKGIKTPKVKVDLKNRNVMALDLASYKCGVTVALKGEIVSTGLISTQGDNFRIRGHEIVDRIIKGIDFYEIDTVVIEDIYLSLNSNILALLAELRGMVTYHLVDKNINIVFITATEWKNSYNMPKGRKEQKDYSLVLFASLTGKNAKSDDEADAYLMMNYVLNKV